MWRFVHMTDPHLGSQRDGQWNNNFLCTMMPAVMQCLKEDLARIKPDFLLVTGDVSSKQTREAMFEARDLMDGLGVPYYPMGGNHDFVLPESRDWFLEAFEHCLPIQRTYYSFTHKGLHFSVLDPWWVWSDGTISPVCEGAAKGEEKYSLMGPWALPQEQLDWLEEDLCQHKHLQTVIANHYPAVRIPDRLRKPGLKDAGGLDNGDALLEVLHRHPQVRVSFAGNVHLHFIEHPNGLYHITTGALPEYPAEFREVEVTEKALKVTTCSLSNPDFAERSLLPGKDWTSGERCDREATIPLG